MNDLLKWLIDTKPEAKPTLKSIKEFFPDASKEELAEAWGDYQISLSTVDDDGLVPVVFLEDWTCHKKDSPARLPENKAKLLADNGIVELT